MKTTIKKDKLYDIAFKKDFITSYPFKEGLAHIEIKKYGIVDKAGNYIVEPLYYDVAPSKEGSIMALFENEKWGLIDYNGEIIFEPKFNWITNLYNNLSLFRCGDKSGIIEKGGKIVLESKKIKEFRFFFGQKLIFKEKDKFGIMDNSGKIILKPIYDKIISRRKESFYPIKKDGKWGYLNSEGKIIIRPKYEKITKFYYGKACVKFKNKWGIINEKGKFIINNKYDYLSGFNSDGITCFAINGKYGAMNANFEIIVKPLYDQEFFFFDGIARIIQNGKESYINEQGKTLSFHGFKPLDFFLMD